MGRTGAEQPKGTVGAIQEIAQDLNAEGIRSFDLGKDALKKLIANTEKEINDETKDNQEYEKMIKTLTEEELTSELNKLREDFDDKQSDIRAKLREIDDLKQDSEATQEDIEKAHQERVDLSNEKRAIFKRIQEIDMELVERQR